LKSLFLCCKVLNNVNIRLSFLAALTIVAGAFHHKRGLTMNVKSESVPKGVKKQTGKSQQRNQMIILAIIGAAVVVALIFILISLTGTTANLDRFANIPETRMDDGAFVLGEADAPITIIEFADFLCPACQDYKREIDPFIDQYVATGQAKFEYRALITAGGDRTVNAYRLAVCGAEQKPGTFFESVEVMFEYGMSGRLDLNVGRLYAERMGLNLSELLRCTADTDQLSKDELLARQLGASSTPAVFVRYGDGPAQPLPGGRSFTDLAQLVQAVNP
jgi:protein-disulfide isomerase